MSKARAIIALFLFGLTAGLACVSAGKIPDPKSTTKPAPRRLPIAKRYLGILRQRGSESEEGIFET